MTPDNDNAPNSSRPASFREKVQAHYRRTNVLPDSATFITTYYMAALLRQRRLDPEQGPVLAGCEKFGAEASPRLIVTEHATRSRPTASAEELAYLVERGLEAAREEIEGRNTNVHGNAYRVLPAYAN